MTDISPDKKTSITLDLVRELMSEMKKGAGDKLKPAEPSELHELHVDIFPQDVNIENEGDDDEPDLDDMDMGMDEPTAVEVAPEDTSSAKRRLDKLLSRG